MSDRTNADRLRFEAVMAAREDGSDPKRDAAYEAWVEFGRGENEREDDETDEEGEA